MTARRLNRGLLVFAVVVSTAITCVSIRWLFSAKWIQSVHYATNGLVNGTLLGNLLQFGIVIGLVIMLLGKARFRDIGFLPQQIAPGSMLADVAVLFLAGLFFAGIFWRTKNLMIAVGLHTLLNSPSCLLTAPDWLPLAVLVLIASLLLFFGPTIGTLDWSFSARRSS